MIEKIRETIHPDYHLEREKKNWLVSGADKKIQFKTPNRRSVGFSLEQKERLVLNIFSDNSPRGILKELWSNLVFRQFTQATFR